MLFTLTNIQSIRRAIYEINSTGITRISGGNSNGKSILIKVLNKILTLEIKNKSVRKDYINDYADEGSVAMEYNGQILVVKLHRETNQCAMILQRRDGTKVGRYFNEDGLSELLHEFGWRVFGNNSVCLQLYETWGPMPFVNTPLAINGEIIDCLTTDSVAKQFCDNFGQLTYPIARDTIKKLTKDKEVAEINKAKMVLYNVQAYEEQKKKLQEIFEIIKWLRPIELKRLEIPPMMNFVDFRAPELKRLQVVCEVPAPPRLNNLSTMIAEMVTMSTGVCPTCGAKYDVYHNHE